MVVVGAADEITGAVLVVAGVWTVRARPRDAVGWLLLVTAASWLLGFAAVSSLPAVADLGAALLYVHRGTLLHAVVVTASATAAAAPGRLVVRCLVVLGYLAAVPPWATSTWVPTSVGLAVLVVVAGAWRRTQRRRHRVGWSLVGGGTAAWVLAADVLRGAPVTVAPWRVATYALGIAVSAVGVATLRVRAGRLAERTLRVVGVEGPESLERALAAALGDDALEVRLHGADDHAVVPPGRERTSLDLGAHGRAVLVHRAGLLADRRLRRDTEVVVRVVVDEMALTERAAAATRQVQASHDRLVAAEERAADQLRADVEERVGPYLSQVADALGASHELVPRAVELLAEIEADLDAVTHAALGDAPPGTDLAGELAQVVHRCPVPAELDVVGDARAVAPERVRALVFVATEAMANVAKHAAARRVVVRLEAGPEVALLRVDDDGRGGARWRPGGGLEGLRRRLGEVDGALVLASGPAGTTLEARVPR